MDWTKAKNILIVALIVTNLVLVATYLIQNSRLEDDEKEMQDVIIKLLEDKNIFVETDIPDEHPRMPKLTVQFDKEDEAVINAQLARQEALTASEQTDENLIAMTSGFIERCGLMTENTVFGDIDRTGNEIRVTYKNQLNGIDIEDSYMICTIRDGRITDFERYWLDPVEVNDIEKEVIPARAALIRFMSEKADGEKIRVQDISLVYWLDPSVFDAESPITDTAFPAWKITYNQGEIHHIMAWEQ
jgi:regulatory protein YycI of two-component signal transduction system YycFG